MIYSGVDQRSWTAPQRPAGIAEFEEAPVRAERDPMIDMDRMPEAVDWYCPNQDKKNPLISPLFADLTGFPPLFVQVGTEEVLFDDSTRLVENAKKANVEVELQVWQEMPHVHQIAHIFVPEAKAALRDIARFFKRQAV